MIVSKPKISTLISLGIFLALVFGVLIYNFLQYYASGYQSVLNLLLMAVLTPIGIGILIKILVGYRIIAIGKNKINIRFPLRFINYDVRLNEISKWKETRIKTFSSWYHELEIQSSSGKKIKLSKQEHTEYDRVLNYLGKKCRNKKIQ
jgi:hypothetical protein